MIGILRFGTNSARRNSIWRRGSDVVLGIWHSLYSPRSRTSKTANKRSDSINAVKSCAEIILTITVPSLADQPEPNWGKDLTGRLLPAPSRHRKSEKH